VVIAGKDKGKKGKVLEVWPEDQKVRVEGIAVQKRHMKPGASQKFPNGGIVDRPAKISLSNVMFFSEKLDRPVRVGIKDDGQGNKTRVARGKGTEEAALD
jgi:large subunit ribosomal protein L24